MRRDYGLLCVGSYKKGDWLAKACVDDQVALEVDGVNVAVRISDKDSKTYVYVVAPDEVESLHDWFNEKDKED